MYSYSMTPLEIFTALGAVRMNDHFVGVSGRHLSTYVAKDVIYPHTRVMADLCLRIATRFTKDNVDVVAAPAFGGVILSQGVAYHLSSWQQRFGEVLGVYAEKNGDAFIFRRGYDKLLANKRVLLVEDVLTTGGSVVRLADAVRKCGGVVIGVGALVNRGDITAQSLGVTRFEAQLDLSLETWEVGECPLCAFGVPVNTEFGHGAVFLETQKKHV